MLWFLDSGWEVERKRPVEAGWKAEERVSYSRRMVCGRTAIEDGQRRICCVRKVDCCGREVGCETKAKHGWIVVCLIRDWITGGLVGVGWRVGCWRSVVTGEWVVEGGLEEEGGL